MADGGREWASEITRAELSAALAAHGLAKPGWQNFTVSRRGESGRAVTLKIDEAEIGADEFRLAVGESLGWNRIPSTWFEVSRQGDGYAFHGRGWGHGVGLCQKGAAAMAQQGRSTQEILAQYFPGTQLADEATGREWSKFAGDGFVLESLDADDAKYITDLNRARAEATERSGLHATAPSTVRAFASTPAFREATLNPGWVAAFTEGDCVRPPERENRRAQAVSNMVFVGSSVESPPRRFQFQSPHGPNQADLAVYGEDTLINAGVLAPSAIRFAGTGAVSQQDVAQAWAAVALSPREALALEAMRMVEPDVEQAAAFIAPVPMLKVKLRAIPDATWQA